MLGHPRYLSFAVTCRPKTSPLRQTVCPSTSTSIRTGISQRSSFVNDKTRFRFYPCYSMQGL